MFSFFSKLPPKSQHILVLCLGACFPILALSIVAIAFKSSDIQYKTEEVDFSLGTKVKQASDDNQKAVDELNTKIAELQAQIYNLKSLPNPEAKQVVKTFEEKVQPVVKEINQQNQELQIAVEVEENLEQITKTKPEKTD